MISVITDEVSSSMETLIKTLKKTKLEYVELRKINDQYLFEIDSKELERIWKTFKNNHYQVSLIDSPIGKHKFSYEKEKVIFYQYIYICKIFHCSYLRIFTDVGDDIFSSLEDYNKIAMENDIVLLLENEKNTKGEDYSYLLKVMKHGYSNIRILYDAENYYSLGYDYKEAFQILKNYISYIHLRDIKEGVYTFLFEGEIDLSFIIDQFLDGFISLETHLSMIYPEEKEKLFLESMKRIKL